MASKSRGWKSPDPAKKRRKEKARKHAAPKVPRPKPRGLPDEDREKVRVASLLSRGAAEIVYEPTHPAPLPVPGVVAGGCHEAKDPVPKWERKALRKTIASIKGPPAPKAVNWRDNTEPDNIVRISRKGNAICVPRKSERLVQEVLVKIHSTLKPTEKTNPVKIERVNLNRLEERAKSKDESRVGKPLRGKKLKEQREKAAKLTPKAAA